MLELAERDVQTQKLGWENKSTKVGVSSTPAAGGKTPPRCGHCRGCVTKENLLTAQTAGSAELPPAPAYVQYAAEEHLSNADLIMQAALECRSHQLYHAKKPIAPNRHECLEPHLSLATLMDPGPTHALCRAIASHDIGLLGALCKWGMDVNEPLPHDVRVALQIPERFGGKEVTPLLMAVLYGNAHVVHTLLRYGAAPQLKLGASAQHDAPVHNLFCEAIYNEHTDVAALLLLHGAQFNYREDDARVYQRFFYAYPWLLRVLLAGSWEHVSAQFEQTSYLHLAVQCADARMVEQLLAAGLDPNLPNHRGDAPMDIMCRTWIRDYPIKVRNGQVLLHQLRVVRCLVAAGATPRARQIPTRVRACLEVFPPPSEPYCVRKHVSAMVWQKVAWTPERHKRWPPRFHEATRQILRLEGVLGRDVVRRVIAAMAEDILVWVDARWILD